MTIIDMIIYIYLENKETELHIKKIEDLSYISSCESIRNWHLRYSKNEIFSAQIRRELQLHSSSTNSWKGDLKKDFFKNENLRKGIYILRENWERINEDKTNNLLTLLRNNSLKNNLENTLKTIKEYEKEQFDQDMIWILKTNYKRDQKIRDKVLKRSNNKCEYCKNKTFQKPDENFYLEVHHIEFLSEGGKDEENNMIALCPNCHRKFHFGKDKDKMKEKLLTKKLIKNFI